MYNPKGSFVSKSGGVLTVTDAETDEILAEVPLTAGIVPMRQFSGLAAVGDWSLSPGVSVLLPRSGYGVQVSDRPHESGANPDWRPTSATRMQAEMRVMVNKLVGKALKAEQRMRAAETLIEMPTRRVAAESQVIEPVEPAPAPQPAPVGDGAK